MKRIILVIFISITNLYRQQLKNSEIMEFSNCLRLYDYQERKDMKIDIPKLIQLQIEDKAELIDIRFPEEVEAWKVGFAKNIPLNELPDRITEPDKNKIIVTVCPHYDRASIARHYLTLIGFNSKYLVEGLLGLDEYLRGDKAKEFILSIKKQNL